MDFRGDAITRPQRWAEVKNSQNELNYKHHIDIIQSYIKLIYRLHIFEINLICIQNMIF